MGHIDNINSPEDIKRMSVNSLEYLAGDIRRFLVSSISVTGGHLASNLGVVELTLALHYCFDTPKDSIVWDVGHQAYVHKIITGRRERFGTLRQYGGLSGFPKSSESQHDAFDAGHSGTSISAALGMAVSRDLSGRDSHVVAVIGDGSMTGGLPFEAMNNAGRGDTDLIVVLNDNQMSISENVGAVSRHLNDIRTAPMYIEAKSDVKRFLENVPFVGGKLEGFIEKTKDTVRFMLVPGVLFEELGFTYVGPIDGHDIAALIRVFTRVKRMRGPVLLHVYTTKGKGYECAEVSPARFHGVDSFHVDTGMPTETKIWGAYSDVFGAELLKRARADKRIVAITAAMPDGTGLSEFAEIFPERMFDVGIAEGHAVTFAAGMAKGGHVPVFAVYSSFLQRAYDQILHDVCIQNLHVVFAVDRAGAVGQDGETHQGLFDLSYLSHMPNMTVMAPKNKYELRAMLAFALEHNGPIALRYPRGAASAVMKEWGSPVTLGKSEMIAEGKDIMIIFLGAMADTAWSVYRKLVSEGHSPALVNARFVKPLDGALVQSLAAYKRVYVLEDGVLAGGLACGIMERAARDGVSIKSLRGFSFPDEFIPHGARDELLRLYGLDVNGIYAKIKIDIKADSKDER